MLHRASDDPEVQLLHNDDDSQAKGRSQTAAVGDGWESEPQQYEWLRGDRWVPSVLRHGAGSGSQGSFTSPLGYLVAGIIPAPGRAL